jgi:hypothetical protein
MGYNTLLGPKGMKQQTLEHLQRLQDAIVSGEIEVLGFEQNDRMSLPIDCMVLSIKIEYDRKREP